MSKQQGPLDLETLRGSIAVVTGAANHGIGWGICQHAAGVLGMDVAIIDLHQTLVDAAVEELASACPDVRVAGFACDVTDLDQLSVCADAVNENLPGARIGAVFANAGVIFNRTILKSTTEEWMTTLNVNVLGVVNTIKAFVPALQANDEQSVVCATASIGGLVRGDGGGAAYQASKHAVVALSESLSFELARKSPQIRVHVLCPCIVGSALGQTSRTNADVRSGILDADEVAPVEVAPFDLAMAPERHAEQVFDHIAAGRFYMITDNVRPYVDHDFPFDGLGIVKERVENMMNLTLDNVDALGERSGRPPSAILKGPMWQEMRRREREGDD